MEFNSDASSKDTGGTGGFTPTGSAPEFETHAEYHQLVCELEETKQALETMSRCLRARDRQLRDIMHAEPGCVKVLDKHGRILEMNARGLAMIEAESLQQVNRQSVYTLINEPYRDAFRRLTEKVLSGGSGALEFQITGLKGTQRWLETHASPWRDDSDEISALLCITLDITSRKETGAALRRNQTQFFDLVESIDGIVWEADAQTFQFTFVSSKAESVLGYPASRWIEEPAFWKDHLHPEDRSSAIAYCVKSTSELKDHEFEYRMVASDGRIVWLRDIVTVVEKDGHPVALRGIMVDISQSKKNEERIQHLNRVYSMLSNINQMIVREQEPRAIIESACQIAVENGGFLCAWINLTHEDSPLQTPAQFVSDRMVQGNLDQLLNKLTIDCPFTSEAQRTKRPAVCLDVADESESSHWHESALALGCRSMISLPLDIDGTLIGGFNIYSDQSGFFDREECRLLGELATDISFALLGCQREAERQQANLLLKASEQRFRQLAETIDEVFWITEPEEPRLLYISPGYEKIWGRSCQSLYEDPHSWREAIHPLDRELVIKGITERVGDGTYDLEYRIIKPDNEIRWVRDWAFLVRNEQGEIQREVGVVRDVTKRRILEDELKQREEYFRLLIENASDLITVIDFDGTIRYQSPALTRILGFDPNKSLNRNLFEYIHPDDFDATKAIIRQIIAKPNQQIQAEFRLNHCDQSWRLIQSVGISIPDQSDFGFIVLNSRDITETRQLEAQFRQAQKMEAIGQLAGGVAHDFNNILAAIMMQVELVGMEPGLSRDAQSGLQDINVYAQRAASLTRQLLLFSRRQIMQQINLDLNEVVKSLAKMLQRIIGEDVKLTLNLHRNPLPILADAGMVDQVLMNLAVNARDAMPEGGKLLIETGVAPPDAVKRQGAIEGAYFWLRVSDTGPGIPTDMVPHIFEPFFTTKDPGKGTGLGLATVFGIVQQHQGWVEASNTEEGGASLKVYLPAKSGTQEVAEEHRPKAEKTSGTETILLVEDDPVLRKLTYAILERRGYHIIVASNGSEARSCWSLESHRIHMLFTDLVMPGGVSGYQLACEFRAERPELKVIFCSGYSGHNACYEMELIPGENFIQKPFQSEYLLQIVRKVLDG